MLRCNYHLAKTSIMPIVYSAQANFVNEGTPKFERLAIKITQIAKQPGEYIKTFPFTDYRNRSVMHVLKHELSPFKKASFIGIGLKSYDSINYIEFYSTYSYFSLQAGDEIELLFEDEAILKFAFQSNNMGFGWGKKNVHPISDLQLNFIANTKLLQWKIVNKANNHALLGGFGYQEDNRQYKSEKTGKQLFKTMARELLAFKAANWRKYES